ncbi:MAG: LamG-like jellyroll fold domain-containing protein [Verrucomicrobiales bacterium]
MKPAKYKDLTTDEQEWIDAYVDGTISPEDFESLQDRMIESAELRTVMRRYLSLDNSLQNEASGIDAGDDASPWVKLEEVEEEKASKRIIGFPSFGPMAAAAAVAFLLGSAWMYWQAKPTMSVGKNEGADMARTNPNEPSAEGFAVVGRLFDASWLGGQTQRREGDMLSSEIFELASGTAEIQFFSGAMMTVEGPAEISLRSAWEAECREGAVRMKVPPAARGFILQAPSTEIVDLGTEFGLEVRDGEGHVEVFDGEIEFHHQEEGKRLVTSGGAWELPSDGGAEAVAAGMVDYPDADRMGSQTDRQRQTDFELWESHRDALAEDDRLIAYYTFDRSNGEKLIPNLAKPRDGEFDGAVVMAEKVDGRWPGMKEALEFRRPGSRVRVNIPGEFPAFTFMTWVRIDALDRWYSALFLGDGYENGEPHWQIRDDGQLMLSVMVDDTYVYPKNPNKNAAGLAKIYFSESIWDQSMSGEWMHIASTFDPANRSVAHFVNGEEIAREAIEDKFFVDKLHIGSGEIGNWGLPHREDPTFAIRNLNGRMDEFAIFKVALSAEEIASLFERSRAGKR